MSPWEGPQDLSKVSLCISSFARLSSLKVNKSTLVFLPPASGDPWDCAGGVQGGQAVGSLEKQLDSALLSLPGALGNRLHPPYPFLRILVLTCDHDR